ncbi:MAG: DUF3108 domain-containing protein [Bacteroidales bacterium]
MKILGKFLVIIFIFLGMYSVAYTQNVNTCGVVNNAFVVGEKVVYEMSYTWLFVWTDVGQVEFTVSADKRFGKDLLHLKATGKSYTFYDWFFKVRDLYESWVDPVTLSPYYFNRDIYEGGFTKENEYRFNWDTNELFVRVRRKKKANRYDTLKIDKCSYDVVTAIYIGRNLDFSNVKPGKVFPVAAIMDETVYNVGYRFLGREEKDVPGLGKLPCLKFQVDVVAGDIFKGDQKIYVWVTDDKNKLPVLIESPIRVGSVMARVKSVSGLKYPTLIKSK